MYYDYTSDFVAWCSSVLSSSNNYAFDRCGQFGVLCFVLFFVGFFPSDVIEIQ